MIYLPGSGRTRSRVASVVAATVVMFAALGLSPMRADAGGSFAGYAEARGLYVSVVNASIPAVQGVEATVPFTTTTLNSLGQSDSYAAAPYPGAIVANLFDVAGALVPLPVPEYPLQVTTAAGDNPKDADFPGISLHAESGASVASAKATVITDATGLTSTSRVEVLADGSLQSVADFAADVVQLGGLLSLSGVKTQAKAVVDSYSGKLRRSTSMQIARLSVPAMNLTLPAQLPSSVSVPNPVPGLPQPPPVPLPPLPIPIVGGMTLQDPQLGYADGQFSVTLPFLGNQTFALPTQAVTDALKPLGITLLVIPSEASTTGVTGSALSFAFSLPAPPDNPLINSPTHATFSLGRSKVSADLRPSLDDFGFVLPAIGDSGDFGNVAGSFDHPGSAGVGSLAPGGLALSGGSSTGAVSDIPPSVPQPSQAVAGPSRQPVLLAGSSLPGVTGIYLLLVCVAALAFVSASLLRLTGVRSRWI